jgi:hypothetical protein
VLRFFSSRRNWDSPNPSPQASVPPPPVLGGGAHSLAREGLGESQFRRGDIHCGTFYIRTLWPRLFFCRSWCLNVGGGYEPIIASPSRPRGLKPLFSNRKALTAVAIFTPGCTFVMGSNPPNSSLFFSSFSSLFCADGTRVNLITKSNAVAEFTDPVRELKPALKWG